MITQNELKKILNYDKNTGIFTWKINHPYNKIKIGTTAGYIRDGYIVISINTKKYYAHRLVWLYITGALPKYQIDHINHIRDDNRFINLREATNQENGKNQTLRSNNTSGFNGINWHKKAKKWLVRIKINGKSKHLGLFINKEDAIEARKKANILYNFHKNHGE